VENFHRLRETRAERISPAVAKLQDRRGRIEDETAEKAPPNQLDFVEREKVWGNVHERIGFEIV
jgi:hypothetical protein